MKYRGSTKCRSGDIVRLLTLDANGNTIPYDEGKVVDALAKQFTCRVGGRLHFYFYEDEGVTWELNGRTK